jgi:hypothetical protein
MTDDIPLDTGSADPGTELRYAAAMALQRHKEGTPAHAFWKVIAGIWERWSQRAELGVELSSVAHAEFQAALYAARRYLATLHEGGAEPVVAVGALSCSRCGHVFMTSGDIRVLGLDLAQRLLGHVCEEPDE